MPESKSMTREDLAGKVEWEGGVSEAITGYGLSVHYLPEDAPDVIRSAWQRVFASIDDIAVIEQWLETGEVREDWVGPA